MPRQNKKRGRRAERKRENGLDLEEPGFKRRRTSEATANQYVEAANLEYSGFEGTETEDQHGEAPFFGLLDESEQEYFRQADSRLENDLFDNDEDRSLFFANVYKEVKGKELKMACSQSASRLLERLMSISTQRQLKMLFQQLRGHFIQLVQHRFASHCCETLFTQAARYVSQDLVASQDERPDPAEEDEPTESTSMEDIFLLTIAEFDEKLGYLISDRYASHPLRVLLLVLSGEEIDATPQRTLLHSRKKEFHNVVGFKQSRESGLAKRAVPQSFITALEKMITTSMLTLDTSAFRVLATHPTGNPMLQVLLRLELTHFGKQRAKHENSLIRKMIPDDPPVKGTDSAAFLDRLTYDPIGSRLLETIIGHSPGKIFKTLYRESWKGRMGSMARNEIAGYVAIKILERLNKKDLEEALADMIPQIPKLAERGRTAIIKAMIERCTVRELDMAPLTVALQSAYSDSKGSGTFSILKLLNFPNDHGSNIGASGTPASIAPSPEHNPAPSSSVDLHASRLAQTMLTVPGSLSTLVLEALQALPTHTYLLLAKHPPASYLLQSALTSPYASSICRRKLIQYFYSHIAELALHRAGSRVVDAVWRGTQGLAFIRERCAEELAENEAALRESVSGRAVWRNWKMDLYRRRRGEWVRQTTIECGNNGFLAFPEESARAAPLRTASENLDVRAVSADLASRSESRGDLDSHFGAAPPKTSLQRARERFAMQQQRQQRQQQRLQQHQRKRQQKGDSHRVVRGTSRVNRDALGSGERGSEPEAAVSA